MTTVHFIGIGGSGLSAIARLMLESGYTVTGSDNSISAMAAELAKAGAKIYRGHAAENIGKADWVVRSSAVPDENPEVMAAKKQGIPVYKRADFLGKLMENKIGIAVAGTHGKTTTTAMLAWTLMQMGEDPSFIVGGVMTNLGTNAHAGKGSSFVIEADEYDRMFLGLKPQYAIVTNIEHDHPDCYPTPADFRAAFIKFARLIASDGALIACGEDMGAIDLMSEMKNQGRRVIGYRIAQNQRTEAGEWVLAQNVMANNLGGFTFNIITRLNNTPDYISGIQLQVPGLHNVRNAMAVLAVIGLMNLDLRAAAKALTSFKGTGRRFEVHGETQGVILIDDYAHHPTEIKATLDAARARYPSRRIWAIWQPHTYSRTQALFNEFAASFQEADQVIISEVYAGREEKQAFSAQQLAEAMKHPQVRFIAELKEISSTLQAELKANDVVLVLSAGDANQISADVLAHLQKGSH